MLSEYARALALMLTARSQERPHHGPGRFTLYTANKGVSPAQVFDPSPPNTRQRIRAATRRGDKEIARKLFGSTKHWRRIRVIAAAQQEAVQ